LLGISFIPFICLHSSYYEMLHEIVFRYKKDNTHYSSKQLDLILTTNGEQHEKQN